MMQPFDARQQMLADFRAVFDSGECSRVCDWNHGPLSIVESAIENNVSEDSIGLIANRKRISCLAEDLPRLPESDDFIELDGEEWVVEGAYQNHLFYVIFLVKAGSE